MQIHHLMATSLQPDYGRDLPLGDEDLAAAAHVFERWCGIAQRCICKHRHVEPMMNCLVCALSLRPSLHDGERLAGGWGMLFQPAAHCHLWLAGTVAGGKLGADCRSLLPTASFKRHAFAGGCCGRGRGMRQAIQLSGARHSPCMHTHRRSGSVCPQGRPCPTIRALL